MCLEEVFEVKNLGPKEEICRDPSTGHTACTRENLMAVSLLSHGSVGGVLMGSVVMIFA